MFGCVYVKEYIERKRKPTVKMMMTMVLLKHNYTYCDDLYRQQQHCYHIPNNKIKERNKILFSYGNCNFLNLVV